MSLVWEAPEHIREIGEELRAEHHPHLAAASIGYYCSDSRPISDNRIVPTKTQKVTGSEKLKTGHDFKVFVRAEIWDKLTDQQRRIALDEALCRCGVKRVPQTMEINGRRETLKDDLGREILTDEIQYDRLGRPKWKLNHPDAGLYFALLERWGDYCEAAENLTRMRDGRPLKGPTAHAARQDQGEGE